MHIVPVAIRTAGAAVREADGDFNPALSGYGKLPGRQGFKEGAEYGRHRLDRAAYT